jgi:glycyl-tRNA synthetase beta chain
MPELLIEFFSEEIPARMQKRGEEDFARLLTEKLAGAGLTAKGIETSSGPRRLALVIPDLPARTPDVNEERKGPRVGAPEQALAGFLKGAGLTSISQAEIVADKKGDFYAARIARAGRDTSAVLAEIIPEIVRAFPWPKSMRSGSSDLTWVRPLHNVLCIFGGKHVPVSLPGVKSEPITWGHRFHSRGAIEVQSFVQYKAALLAAKVEIDREARKARILDGARRVCAEKKLELVEDAGLLEEVSGLSEWPVVVLGDMDASFLDLPAEVIRLTMRTHQRYFAVREAGTGKLAPHFVTVANIEATDGGKAIAAGNARVLTARLSDARHFWDVDRFYDPIEKTKPKPLYNEERVAKLKQIVFHQKLGSVWDKVERVKALALELCAVTGADKALVEQAANLMKMDLVTETVGEFPELQGQIGRQLYAQEPSPLAGEGREGGRSTPATANSIAIAIEDHYRPVGANDRVPSDPISVTVALADKLDTLVGFWAINERPTGSSDAYGLRRSALGLVRVILQSQIRFADSATSFTRFADTAAMGHFARFMFDEGDLAPLSLRAEMARKDFSSTDAFLSDMTVYRRARGASWWLPVHQMIADLLAFLAERLKVQLREQGKRHDLVDAVFALGDDDLVRIVARVEALDAFLRTQDGANLLAGYKRAANILRAEEKKNTGLSTLLQSHELRRDLVKEAEEKALLEALERAQPNAEKAIANEDFASAMAALAQLRAPVDNFFERVLVNAEDESVRLNRLKLLTRMRDALHAVADFSKIEG